MNKFFRALGLMLSTVLLAVTLPESLRCQPQEPYIDRYMVAGGATRGTTPDGGTIFGTIGQPLLLVVDDDDEARFIRNRGLVDGFWHRSPLSDVFVSGVEVSRSEGRGEVSVAPQPAQDHLRFDLSLEESATIELSFYDMFGREIDRRPSVELDAGPQSIAYDSDRLATGSYLCVLTVRSDDSLRVLSVPLNIIR